MAHLRVAKGEQLVMELNLDPDQTYLAGRADNCQIKLDPEPGISRHHFQISFDAGAWKLEVLSRFGELYSDSQKTSGFVLEEGKTFSVPPYAFEFMEKGVAQDAAINSHEATVISMLPSSSFLRVIDERGMDRQIFRLEGDTWTVGRDISCAVHLEYPKASRKQCEIYRESENFFIRDLGSANGTSVNGHPLSREEWTRLQSGDTITIIDWIIKFEVRDSSFANRLESVSPELKNPNVFEDIVQPDQGVPNLESTRIGNAPMPPPQPGTWQDVHAGSANPYGMPLPEMAGSQMGPESGFESSPAPLQTKKKFLNPVRILMILIILGAGGAYLYQNLEGGANKEAAPVKAKAKSPFDLLSEEDKQFVRRAYDNAKQDLIAHKYAEALQDVNRMKQKIAVYEDSADLEQVANAGILEKARLEDEERREQREREAEETINKVVETCGRQMSPTWTSDRLEQCLTPALQLNPTHMSYQPLRDKMAQWDAAKVLKEQKRSATAVEVGKLRKIFNEAEALVQRNKIWDAIDTYQLVVDSKLADTEGLKPRSKKARWALLSKLEGAQAELEMKADGFMKEGHYRDAVVALRSALEINPQNEVCKGRLQSALFELKKQMQPDYQNSIVEESIGDVEKAKERWKKIMLNSTPGEDYYEKSRIKLKKYGATQ